MYIIIFIQCTLFMASYVYCARQPPAAFYDDYIEEKCLKLNHVFSHANYRDKSALSLDLICETYHSYDLASFASSELTVTRVDKSHIKIVKIEHNVTIINFKTVRRFYGQATFYFESTEDAKNFNRDIYTKLKSQLVLFMRIGKIDKVLPTQPDRYPVATQFANIYYERRKKSNPIKFVIEADGVREPLLVFTHEEFDLTMDEREGEDDFKCVLKVGGTATPNITDQVSNVRSQFENLRQKVILMENTLFL